MSLGASKGKLLDWKLEFRHREQYSRQPRPEREYDSSLLHPSHTHPPDKVHTQAHKQSLSKRVGGSYGLPAKVLFLGQPQHWMMFSRYQYTPLGREYAEAPTDVRPLPE